MSVPVAIATLAPARRQILRLMQDLNFGWIENLTILDGNPVLDPRPTIVRYWKVGSDNQPRPESRMADFPLKQPVTELFAQFDRIGNGMIRRLEVKHGLPFAMILEEPAA